MEWYCSRPIAHRGLHKGNKIPENSLAAIEEAIAHDYPVELDLRRLKDGTIVVFHDENLERMCGVKGKVSQLTKQSLPLLRLNKTRERIPTLRQVLDLVKGRVPLLFEIKNASRYDRRPEKTVYKRLVKYSGEVAIQSFNPYTLMWLKKWAPGLDRGLLSYNYEDSSLREREKFFLRNLLYTPLVWPDFIGYHHQHLHDLPVKFLKRLSDIPVLAWTVRSQREWERCRPYCQNIIFENFWPR